jgi:hypothetical protein
MSFACLFRWLARLATGRLRGVSPRRNGANVHSEQRMASGEDASGCSSSHSPHTTRRITRTRPLTSTSLPPWAAPCSCSRLPPAGADATAEGRAITAGRTGSETVGDDGTQRSDCFSVSGFRVPYRRVDP